MTRTTVPKVFLSHSHVDKRIARRLVRRLTAHGIRVWLDERELRVGAALASSIRSQIDDSDTLLVIASPASTDSHWVGLELDFARERGKTVIPFFIEGVAQHERFRDYLGVDATSPQTFADAVQGLMRDLFVSLGLTLPPPDPSVLTVGLRDLAREQPLLAPLIIGCLDLEGLHQDNMATVHSVEFHALDEALNALLDLTPDENTAFHAAYGFRRVGAGSRALRLWITTTGDGGLPLVTAVGDAALEPGLIPTAITLLAACHPPNNHALYEFIAHNSAQFDDAQRRSVIRLVTWPIRANANRLGDVLGWVAFKHFPDAGEIQQMWIRWVQDGVFDRETGPMRLAQYLTDANKEELAGWVPVGEALQNHVRTCLRSCDRDNVIIAMDHVRAAADAGAPTLASLLREADGVSGTAEWDDWRRRDLDMAEWMEEYVREFAREAAGDRDWPAAWEGAKHRAVLKAQLRRILEGQKQEPGEGNGVSDPGPTEH